MKLFLKKKIEEKFGIDGLECVFFYVSCFSSSSVKAVKKKEMRTP